MADGTQENIYALTTLAKVKAAMDKTELTGVNDAALIDLINGVSTWCERHCKRKFLTRSYAHTEAGDYDLLDSRGGRRLFLPQRPVTAVASVKKSPDGDALTEGWDEDFTIQKGRGILLLAPGQIWPAEPTIEITYTAGYLSDTGVRSWQDECQDLENSIIRAVAFFSKRRTMGQDAGVSVMSTESGSYSFDFRSAILLADVKSVWDSYAGRRF